MKDSNKITFKCPKCNKTLNQTMKSCPICGLSIEEAMKENPKSPTKNSPVFRYGCGCLLMLFSLGIIGSIIQKSCGTRESTIKSPTTKSSMNGRIVAYGAPRAWAYLATTHEDAIRLLSFPLKEHQEYAGEFLGRQIPGESKKNYHSILGRKVTIIRAEEQLLFVKTIDGYNYLEGWIERRNFTPDTE